MTLNLLYFYMNRNLQSANSFNCHTSEKSPRNSNLCHTSNTGIFNPIVCHTSETPPGACVPSLLRWRVRAPSAIMPSYGGRPNLRRLIHPMGKLRSQ